MILNGEDPVFWLHPTTTFSAEDSEGQENDPRLTLATRPSLRQVFIPVPNSNDAAAAAPPTRDLSSSSSLGRSTRDSTSSDIRRTPSSESSNISGFTRSELFNSMAEAASSSTSSEQVENDDPFPTLVLAPPPQQQQRGSGLGRLGNGRRVSSDPEVCELFRESSSDVRVTTMRCGGGSKVAGFQRWQRKVEGQRSVHGGPMLVASSSSKTFGGDHVVPGRYRGQLRDLNVIQRPSLDFDKMQRYCLTRVHPTRGISKPRIVKVKQCLPGSTSSFSSLGRVIRSELLDPSIFSFRSISQNPSITSSSSSNRRSSATTPSLSDEN